MNDVVDFSSYKQRREVKEQEHFDYLTSENTPHTDDENITMMATAVVDYMLDLLLNEEEIDVRSEPAAVREVLLCLESIRGMLHRVNGTTSNIHKFTEDIFTEEQCEEIMTLFF